MKKNGMIALILILLMPLLAAQPEIPDYVTGANSTGVTPFGSYAGSRENIDLNNLNLNVVIPLFTLRGRNGLDITIAAHYNSIQREWIEREVFGQTVYNLESIAASGSAYFEVQIAPQLTWINEPYQAGAVQMNQNRFLLRRIDGTRSELVNKDYDGDVPVSVFNALERFRSTDASGMELRELVNGTRVDVYLKDGIQIRFDGFGASPAYAQYIRDTNGNKVTFNVTATANPQTLTDTLNRVVERRTYTEGTESVIEIKVLQGSGTALIYKLRKNQAQTLQTLEMPNGLNFLLEFADVGPLKKPDGTQTSIMDRRLTKVTYPGGGYTRYAWALAENNTKTVLASKHVEDGFGEDTFSYSKVPGASAHTRVQRGLSGDHTRHYFQNIIFPPNQVETKVEFYDTSSLLKRSHLKVWDTTFGDPRMTRETTILNDVTPNLHKKTEYSYDASGYLKSGGARTSLVNITEIREFDWGSGAPGAQKRRTTRSYLQSSSYNLDNLHILNRMTQQAVYPGTSSTAAARSDYFYDEYASPWTLLNTSGAVQRDSAFGTAYATRGNLSRIVQWLSGVDPTTRRRYDICGNVVEEKDPLQHSTLTTYNSTTQFAYPTQVTDPKGFVRSFSYDYSSANSRGLGYLLTETDVSNGNLTTSHSYDAMGRLTQTLFPDGGRTKLYYSDLNLATQHEGAFVFKDRSNKTPLRSKAYTLIHAGTPPLEKSELVVFDGLGRSLMTATSNGTSMDWARTEYDTYGRAWRTSNPVTLSYSTEAPDVTASFTKWTTTSYDALDRVVQVQTQDLQAITTLYSGRETTVTDQLGNPRRTTEDGLGRISIVREPKPSNGSMSSEYLETFYAYDALDNLTTVTQGSQTRSFVYDSLSRLTSETHPESGATSYGYDSKGNRTSRTDARGIVTTYDQYDALDRLGRISYSSASAPTVTFSYDSASVSYGKGRLTGRVDGAGSETFGYDKLGRPASQKRINTAGPTLDMQYVYNLAGGVVETRFPGILDGAYALTVFQEFDNTGRSVGSWWSNGTTANQDLVDGYTSSFSAGSGGTETTYFANGTNEVVTYSIRMQPTRRLVRRGTTPLMDLFYSFNRPTDGKNNGNVFSLDDDVVASRDQTFGYDYLNRLTSAAGTGVWTSAYSYDRYGNLLSRTATGAGEGNLTLTVSESTNRLSCQGAGCVEGNFSYDAAGNMTAAPGGKTYQYDGEGRMKSSNNGSLGTYSYDGEGRRVKKVANGETRYYFYDQEGRAIWENVAGVGWETFNHYFHGRLTVVNSASAMAATLWVYPDNLGSPRVKANSLGTVVSRDWYFPFGASWSPSNDGVKMKYTAKERDAETGMDYFGARYMSSFLGRFASSDPLNPILEFDSSQFEDYVANPQNWNRYAYTLNNPLKYVDRDGKIAILPVLVVIWGVYEVGSTIYDAYTAYETLNDPNASNLEKGAAVTGLGVSILAPGGGYGTGGRAAVKAGNEIAGQIHHIATDKNIVGGFTAAFEKIFSKAGLNLQDPLNKVFLEGHRGRHSSKYHDYVLKRLEDATEGLSGDSYKKAVEDALQTLRKELEKNPDLVRGVGLQ